MTVTLAIPARLDSSRLPRKLLQPLGGHPLLWHTWRRAHTACPSANVVIVTDSEEIRCAAQSWGGQTILSSPNCESGTARIASVLEQLPGEQIVNLQGDEPFIDSSVIQAVVAAISEHSLASAVYPLTTGRELQDANIVKVVRSHSGNAIYFSRSPVPHCRDLPIERWPELQCHWGHIGIYGFFRSTLANYASLPFSALEAAERLEQLRWLEAGFTIQTVETENASRGIDTADDLEWARQYVEQDTRSAQEVETC